MQKLLLVFHHSEIAPQAKSGKYFQIWFFPRFGGKKWRRSEHAHASYPGLFFRPPGFSPYMGREERGVQGLDYPRSRYVSHHENKEYCMTSHKRTSHRVVLYCSKLSSYSIAKYGSCLARFVDSTSEFRISFPTRKLVITRCSNVQVSVSARYQTSSSRLQHADHTTPSIIYHGRCEFVFKRSRKISDFILIL